MARKSLARVLVPQVAKFPLWMPQNLGKRPWSCGLEQKGPHLLTAGGDLLQQEVHKDSIISSDGLRILSPLAECFNQFHIPVDYSQKAVEASPDVHRIIARLKTWIRGTHSHVSGKDLNRYLAEFYYRSERRFK